MADVSRQIEAWVQANGGSNSLNLLVVDTTAEKNGDVFISFDSREADSLLRELKKGGDFEGPGSDDDDGSAGIDRDAVDNAIQGNFGSFMRQIVGDGCTVGAAALNMVLPYELATGLSKGGSSNGYLDQNVLACRAVLAESKQEYLPGFSVDCANICLFVQRQGDTREGSALLQLFAAVAAAAGVHREGGTFPTSSTYGVHQPNQHLILNAAKGAMEQMRSATRATTLANAQARFLAAGNVVVNGGVSNDPAGVAAFRLICLAEGGQQARQRVHRTRQAIDAARRHGRGVGRVQDIPNNVPLIATAALPLVTCDVFTHEIADPVKNSGLARDFNFDADPGYVLLLKTVIMAKTVLAGGIIGDAMAQGGATAVPAGPRFENVTTVAHRATALVDTQVALEKFMYLFVTMYRQELLAFIDTLEMGPQMATLTAFVRQPVGSVEQADRFAFIIALLCGEADAHPYTVLVAISALAGVSEMSLSTLPEWSWLALDRFAEMKWAAVADAAAALSLISLTSRSTLEKAWESALKENLRTIGAQTPTGNGIVEHALALTREVVDKLTDNVKAMRDGSSGAYTSPAALNPAHDIDVVNGIAHATNASLPFLVTVTGRPRDDASIVDEVTLTGYFTSMLASLLQRSVKNVLETRAGRYKILRDAGQGDARSSAQAARTVAAAVCDFYVAHTSTEHDLAILLAALIVGGPTICVAGRCADVASVEPSVVTLNDSFGLPKVTWRSTFAGIYLAFDKLQLLLKVGLSTNVLARVYAQLAVSIPTVPGLRKLAGRNECGWVLCNVATTKNGRLLPATLQLLELFYSQCLGFACLRGVTICGNVEVGVGVPKPPAVYTSTLNTIVDQSVAHTLTAPSATIHNVVATVRAANVNGETVFSQSRLSRVAEADVVARVVAKVGVAEGNRQAIEAEVARAFDGNWKAIIASFVAQGQVNLRGIVGAVHTSVVPGLLTNGLISHPHLFTPSHIYRPVAARVRTALRASGIDNEYRPPADEFVAQVSADCQCNAGQLTPETVAMFLGTNTTQLRQLVNDALLHKVKAG